MDIRRLEIFLKLMETGSFSKTARSLGIAQPSVSSSIKALEDDFGQKFFIRNTRRVVPLAPAKIFLPFATKIVETAGEAAWTLSHQLASSREKLTLGSSSVPSLVMAPRAMASFHKLYPKVFLRLLSSDSAEVARQVASGVLDLGLVGSEQTDAKLWSKPLMSDHLVLVCSPRLLKTMRDPPETVEALAGWPLILREQGSGTRAAFFSSVQGGVADFNFKAEVEGLEPTLALVRASFGAAVVSSLLPGVLNFRDLRVFDLDFGRSRRFYLIGRLEGRDSPVAEAMSAVVSSLAAGFEPPAEAGSGVAAGEE
ncbi:MAG: LysR family transcriptional regulator [Deltaproteobacteria bacterium]|jgi:DNA-binding transcriptional LysR family regulator|nr:LysR family transcriptional regulator [Deltaproteobacteria bacterium]